MNNPDEIIKLYEFIESNFELSRLVYKDINVWPIIRAQVGFDLSFKKSQNVKVDYYKRKTFFYYVKLPYRFLKLKVAKSRFLNSIVPLKNEVQILTYPQTFFVDKIENRNYSRYIDPYYEILKNEYPNINRFGFIKKDDHTQNLYHPCQNNELKKFTDYIEIESYLNSFTSKHISEVNKMTGVLSELNDLVDTRFNIKPFHKNLLYWFEELVNFKIYFDSLFEKSKVKLIFLDCFYDTFRMAMCASAKEFGIKVVEIQHGGAEDNVYVPYLKHTINYTVLPDYLWCWSKSDKELILRHNGTFKHLRPFVGGNMWLKKFIQNELGGETLEEKQFYDEIKNKYQKLILITLQPVFISHEVIKSVILNAPVDYFFLIRFHPFNTQIEKENFKNLLKEQQNVEIELSSKLNLFQLFKYADFQLTHSSTTAMEALTFNLPTIICSEYGYDFYKDQIRDGAILFSTDYKKILELFKESDSALNKEMVDYYGIKSDPLMAINNFKEVYN